MKSFKAAALAAALMAPAMVWAQAAKPIEFRVSHQLSADSYQGKGVAMFVDNVKRLSNGRLLPKAIPDGALGSETKTAKDVADGNLEMIVNTTTSLAPLYKPMVLWDTPLLFANVQEADAVLDGPPGQKVLDGMASVGLVGLAYYESGFRNLTNNLRPVNSPEDFNGMKLRVMPTEIATSAFKRLNVDVRPLPFPEVIPAIKAGTIDGQETPLAAITAYKLHEVQKYLTLTNHVYSPFVVVASKKWWDTLSAADQKVLRDAALQARAGSRVEARKAADQSLEQIKARGLQVNALDGRARAAIAYRLEKNVAAIASQVGLPLWIETNNMLVERRNKK